MKDEELKKEKWDSLHDDAYIYADKSGEPGLLFLVIVLVALGVVAVVLKRYLL